MNKKLCILIDGTSGSGKSSLAEKLAKELGLKHIETGLYYRMLGRHMIEAHGFDYRRILDLGSPRSFIEEGIAPPLKEEALAFIETLSDPAVLAQERMKSPPQHLALSDERVAAAASCFAPMLGVRMKIKQHVEREMQNLPQECQGVVLDGRGMGNEMDRAASIRFFVTADEEARVSRVMGRYKHAPEEERAQAHAEVPALLRARDVRDLKRDHAPNHWVFADKLIDNTRYSPEETMNAAMEHVRAVLAHGNSRSQSWKRG